MAAEGETEEESSFLTTWDDYFMAHAHINSLRSTNFMERRGACLVDKGNKIISNSYNGRPYVHDPETKMRYKRTDEREIGAVENSFYFKTRPIEEGCRLFLTHFPTRAEIDKIITNNVKVVVYGSEGGCKEIEKIKTEYETVLTFEKKKFQMVVSRISSKQFAMKVESATLNIAEDAEGLM